MTETQWLREGRLDPDAVIPALRSFLGLLIRAGQFELRAEITAPPPEAADDIENAELVVDFHGPDAPLLTARQGELLRAIEHVALRWLRLDPRYYDHIRFDCEGYRAGRLAELRLAAETAAERVRLSRAPFRFQPMTPRERRIIHLALKDAPGVRTASEGEGDLRAVVIYPA
ncbi:MAG: single-stranded DNA-binding protein [Acidobacteria bacterium]|nr:single-stranded DNA-binding protein [Acidobacteriota bacterium]